MIIEVETEAGPDGEALPRRFFLGERIVRVEAMLDHWPGEDHGYYKLTGDDGARYILRHDLSNGRWELWMYDRPVSGAAPALPGDACACPAS